MALSCRPVVPRSYREPLGVILGGFGLFQAAGTDLIQELPPRGAALPAHKRHDGLALTGPAGGAVVNNSGAAMPSVLATCPANWVPVPGDCPSVDTTAVAASCRAAGGRVWIDWDSVFATVLARAGFGSDAAAAAATVRARVTAAISVGGTVRMIVRVW